MRLIDADALRQRMYHEAFETDTDMQKWDSGCWIRYKLFENCIESAHTVSPDEVRGVGKWLERDDYDWDIYHECSVCHTPFTMLDGTTPELNDYHYCPNCGAKMEVSEDA